MPDPTPSTLDPEGARRRRHPRARAEWPLTISLAEGYFQAVLRDISTAGACFHLDREVAEMSVLSLQLDLPGLTDDGAPHRIHGSGVVVRCVRISPAVAHWEVAVFFHELSDQDRDALALFVERSAAGGPDTPVQD